MPRTTYHSPSLIIRTSEYGESDLLVSFFTEDHGRLRGIAKGARRSSKRFVNCLDIFSYTDLEYHLRERSGLHFIHSGRLMEAYSGLRTDYGVLTTASYMAELVEILLPPELKDQNLFHLLRRSFEALSAGGDITVMSALFEIMALSIGGFGINFDTCCVCGRSYTRTGTAVFQPSQGRIACQGCRQISARTPRMSPRTVELMECIGASPPEAIVTTMISPEVLAELQPVLRLHREYRLGKRLKTTACHG